MGRCAQANADYNLSFSYASRIGSPAGLDLLRSAREKWTRVGDRAGVGRAAWALATFLHFGRRGTINPAQLDEAHSMCRSAAIHERAATASTWRGAFTWPG